MFVIDLRDDAALLPDLTGGKAASLAQLHALGIPSPEGFCIAIEAYRDHMRQLLLRKELPSHICDGHLSLNREELRKVRECIVTSSISRALRQAIKDKLDELATRSRATPLKVAVRSSATAEDSRDASFAGQYDTYLNISGEDAIVQAIMRCWASFWNERAYLYRVRRGFDHWNMGMAVIVEELMPSKAAGTLFTLNPVTKNEKEQIVEACWGLGELVVSGRVTPDVYYVSNHADTPVLTKKVIKAKRRMLLPQPTGQEGLHEVEVQGEQVHQQVLADSIILELVKLGQLLVKHYGCHQDIEWAFHNNSLTILQSRPITSL